MTPQPAGTKDLPRVLSEVNARACVVMAGDMALKHIYPYPDTKGVARTAVHEASHCIASLALGMHFRCVEVYPTPVEVRPGLFEHGAMTLTHPVEGIALTTSGNSDFRRLLQYARKLSQMAGRTFARTWLRVVRDETDELVKSHLDAIRFLSRELERRHTLSYQDVIGIARNHWAFASVRAASPHHWSSPA